MKKLLSLFAGLALVVPLMAGATAGPDACDQQFVHEGGGDYSDSRMTVDIQHNTLITISAQPDYEVIEVFLAVEGDGHVGYWQYASGPVTDFNPSGGDITGWKVRVKKTCTPPPVDVCPNIDGVQATIPEGLVLTDGQCVAPVTPPLTCDTGFHVSGETCVPDDTATSTPPVDEGTSTPPVVETNPNNPQPNQTSGGSMGGQRHCDTPTTPTCAEWVKTIGNTDGIGTIGDSSDNPLSTLSGLLNQLYNILYSLVPHDYKG